MRHGEERTGDSGGGCGGEDLIEKRNEDSEAFERKTFGAEIALLDDLLEEIGANELGEDVFLIGLGGGLLDSLLQLRRAGLDGVCRLRSGPEGALELLSRG